MYKLYHNPRCSKSRAALEFLTQNHYEIEVIEYLNTPLSQEDILRILEKLTVAKHEIIRRGDDDFKVLNISNVEKLSDDEIVKILLKTPKLMQRPILETETQAAIARPLEDMIVILE
ncbi:ArsC/Spx/MgsR family protein [Cysteiniphilum halobium]|uniref:ArsC/Spx/MgsR family protein n=1 Tax=Cysteiniphilum halobium TaxID=2219059 RepID=UPI003F85411D